MKKLYVASASSSRALLLTNAGIEFSTMSHAADESSVRFEGSFHDYVLAIAQAKMLSLDLSNVKAQEGDEAYFLTADTLAQAQDEKHTILGKPGSRKEADDMLDVLNDHEALVVTGCSLSYKVYRSGCWVDQKTVSWTSEALVSFQVPRDMRDEYFTRLPFALKACGGAIIEGYGNRFLRSVNGSYSAVLGLPLPELLDRMALRG